MNQCRRCVSALRRLFFAAELVLLFSGAWLGSLMGADAAVLTAPQRVYAGGRSAATLTTFDSDSRQPLGRQFALFLVSADGTQKWNLGTGATGPTGQQRIDFNVPLVPAGAYALQAVVAGLGETLAVSTTVTNVPAILIETDKAIYKPAQTIQGRVVLLDNSLNPKAGRVEVTFHDAKGLRIARRELLADGFGAAPFSLDLANELNFGTWKIRARSEGAASVRDIKVEEYTLPRYDVSLIFPKSWALVDEAVRGTVKARYFFGKDVEGSVRVSAKRWVGKWEEYAAAEGRLSNGQWSFQLPPVRFVSGTVGAGGQGKITLDVSVTDSAGNTQRISDALTITDAPVILTLVSRSKSLTPGIAAEIVVTSKVPEGHPVGLVVDTKTRFFSQSRLIGEIAGSIFTVNGAGLLTVVPPPETAFAEISARAQFQGRSTSTTIRVGGAHSPSASFLSLARVNDTGTVPVGQVLTFSVLSTHPGTVYYEVYAGGRTVLSNATEAGTFSFAVTPEMLPRAKVVAYKINPTNEVAADSISFDVALPVSVSVAARFSSGQVKPGDAVQVTVDAGTGKRTLLGLSIVDNSVLALGRSRLHLEQVFEELERRFLEPQSLVTEDANGLTLRTRGAMDVLKEAGLGVAASRGITVPEGRRLGGGGTLINISPVPPGGTVAAVPEPPRLRQFFPETWVWEPLLLTDSAGKATLTLQVPDTITSWKLSVVSTCPEPPSGKGGIGFGEAELRAFQDFFVEPSLPVSVVRGERFPLKLDVFNYLDRQETVSLQLEAPKGFELEGTDKLSVTVPPNSATAAEFPIRVTGLGELPVKITALGSSHSDAVLHQLKVVPEGRPVEQVINGVIEAGQEVLLQPLVLPVAIEGSTRAFIHLTPSPVAQTMKGVSDLLRMPYGCGEQNMIFLAPDIEILKYLREIGELAPEIRAKAEHFINVGYQRELTFRTEDGGFASFPGKTGSLWLTAFVLSTFSGAREVRDIDETILARAAAMLLSRQNADGSFQPDRFLIHSEMEREVTNLYAMTAYVTNALADYGGQEVGPALGKAAAYLEKARLTFPALNNNAYPLSIAAVALQKISGFQSAAEQIIERLLQLSVREGVGIHWKPYPVETTGYAIMALLMSNSGRGRPEAQQALDWLSTQRNSLGGFGRSTQDTVVALRALFLSARKIRRDISVDLTLFQGARKLFSVRIDGGNFDLLHQFELPAGTGPFTLRSVGTGSVGYQLVSRFNVPGDFLPPPRDMLLDVFYDTSHIEVDDVVDVRVTVQYTGKKERTGMVIADVGVPTGFEVVRSSLDALVNNKIVQRADLAGRKVIFYIESLTQGQTLRFAFQIRALYPVRAEGPVSMAYEYYDSSVEAYYRQDPVIVSDGGKGPTLASTSPGVAPAGTRITIHGTGFLAGDLKVYLNGIEGKSVEIINDTMLQVTIPNLTPGTVRITVITQRGSFTLSKEASLLTVRPLDLYFPFYQSTGTVFTGFAVSNSSARDATLRFTAYSADGKTQAFPRNPAAYALKPGSQLALLSHEIFSVAGTDAQSGWIEMTTDNIEIGSFFQFGDVNQLDGSAVFSGKSRKLYFTRVFEGTAFRGQRATTFLSIANPNPHPITLKLSLLGSSPLVGQQIRTLPPKGFLFESVSKIFGEELQVSNAHVEVEVTEGEGAVGFELVKLPSRHTVIGLNASQEGEAMVAYSAQLASSPSTYTNLKLLNTSSQRRSVTFRAIAEDGTDLADAVTLKLEGREIFERDVDKLFAFRSDSVVGSLSLRADGPGVIGDVIFGDRTEHKYAASLPLQTQKFTRAVFSHVANVAGFFTGLAFHNPGAETADVTIQVFSDAGVMIGEKAFQLKSGYRVSRLLSEFIPSTEGRSRGSILIHSSRPLVAQELFGERELNLLSAVPPTILEP